MFLTGHICTRTQLPNNLGELSDTKVFFIHRLIKSMITPVVSINHGYLIKNIFNIRVKIMLV